MKWISLLSAFLIMFTVVACEQGDSGAEVEGTEEEAVIPDQQRQMTIQSIDARLSEFDQDIASLEERAQATDTPAELRDEIQDGVLEARDDIQEIGTNRANLEQATTAEEFNSARANLWEEIREVDLELTEAKLQAPEDLETYRTVVQEEIQDLEQDISELESQGAGLATEERAEFDEDLATLTESRTQLDSMMTELDSATESDWEDIRTRINDEVREVKADYYDVLIPGVGIMGLDAPDIDAPELDAPDVDAPNVDAPDVEPDGSDAETRAEPEGQQ